MQCPWVKSSHSPPLMPLSLSCSKATVSLFHTGLSRYRFFSHLYTTVSLSLPFRCCLGWGLPVSGSPSFMLCPWISWLMTRSWLCQVPCVCALCTSVLSTAVHSSPFTCFHDLGPHCLPLLCPTSHPQCWQCCRPDRLAPEWEIRSPCPAGFGTTTPPNPSI